MFIILNVMFITYFLIELFNNLSDVYNVGKIIIIVCASLYLIYLDWQCNYATKKENEDSNDIDLMPINPIGSTDNKKVFSNDDKNENKEISNSNSFSSSNLSAENTSENKSSDESFIKPKTSSQNSFENNDMFGDD